MWESYGSENEDMLWTCIAFTGGIAGQQAAPCGAVSAAAVCLGLRHRWPLADKPRAKQERLDAREDAGELVTEFAQKFGAISCRELIGLDFSRPEVYRQFLESGLWKDKCLKYVQFVVEKLYTLDEQRAAAAVRPPQKLVIYTTPGCRFCAEAKQDLEERGVVYEEISTEGNPQALEDVMRLSGGSGIVPVLVSGEEVKVGFGGG
jgi:C_GCAxxG_C_C family probable redox protein